VAAQPAGLHPPVSAETLGDGVRLRDEHLPDAPPPGSRYRRRIGPLAAAAQLWRSREMVRSIAERELRSRYKQTYLGYAWAVITPLTLMIVFTLFFRRVANVDTGGVPYALFAYLGLIPWGFFSTSMSQGGSSLINNTALLNKVYCPREVFPLGSVSVAAVDTAISLSALIVLFLVNGFMPKPEALLLPIFWAVQIIFTLGVVLLVSSVMVYFRDLRATLPLILQLGLFATPVAYGMDNVPRSFRTVYVIVNPMAAVIEASRRTVLYGLQPNWVQIGLAALSASALLAFAYWVFKRLETGIADVA
jgi:ABC-2 type transport system permease protein/lipopolysaccharide transport system permease protein